MARGRPRKNPFLNLSAKTGTQKSDVLERESSTRSSVTCAKGVSLTTTGCRSEVPAHMRVNVPVGLESNHNPMS
jgi:hypothetical protein